MSGAENANSVAAGGKCLCGACAFTASLPSGADGAVDINVCHCGMCRRWGAGPYFAVHLAEPARFDDGAPVGVYRGSDWAERGFCKQCGTGLFWRLQDGSNMALPVGLFDDQSQFRLRSEIYIDHKPAFYALEGDRPRLTEAEVVAAFQGGGA